MVKDYPYEVDIPAYRDPDELVVTSKEAPCELRAAAAALIELDNDSRAPQGVLSRWRRGEVARWLYRLADHLEEG